MFRLAKSNKNLVSTSRLAPGLAIALTCSTIFVPSALCAEKAEAGYQFEQKSLLVGNITVRIYPKAVQVLEHGRNIIYSSHAPDWKLQILNPAEKTYFEGNIDEFSGTLTRGLTLFTGRMLSDAKYSPPTKQAEGLLLYTTSPEYLKKATEARKNVSNSNGNPKSIDVWVNPAVPAPPRAVVMLGRVFGLACPPGFPVRVRYFDFDHEEKVYLKTSTYAKKQFTEADFAKRSASWKQVASSTAVFQSRAQDEAVKDMLGDFGDVNEKDRKR